jgi:hypothetical protein
VATDWGPVTQTGIGALAAVVGAFVGAWAQGRNQRRTERQQRREKVAAVLADVTAFLDDANPDDVSLHHGSLIDAEKRLLAPLDRRRQELRMQLLRLSTAHPSAKVRRLAIRLDDMLLETLTALRAVEKASQPPATEQNHEQATEQARAQLGKTRGVLSDLVNAIQRT